MNPLKAESLLSKVDTPLPEEVLRDLHDFYWNQIRKSVIAMDDLYIMIPHLGTFGIKGDRVLQKELDKTLSFFREYSKHPPKTPMRIARFKSLETKVKKLQRMLSLWRADEEEKKIIKNQRSEIRDYKKNLEIKGPDNGRIGQQLVP